LYDACAAAASNLLVICSLKKGGMFHVVSRRDLHRIQNSKRRRSYFSFAKTAASTHDLPILPKPRATIPAPNLFSFSVAAQEYKLVWHVAQPWLRYVSLVKFTGKVLTSRPPNGGTNKKGRAKRACV
jgi:hypothetical protein